MAVDTDSTEVTRLFELRSDPARDLARQAGGGRIAADHLLTVASRDPCVVKEMQVTTYHILWELVHVLFEQPGVLGAGVAQ